MTSKKTASFLLLLLFQILQSQHTDIINSNRPGESMSAYAVGNKVIQLESGLNYISENHKLLNYAAKGIGFDLNIRYGILTEELELITNVNYQNDTFTDSYFENSVVQTNRSSIKNLGFGAKYLIYDPYKNYKEKINIYSWKANYKFKWRQLIPAVSLFAGASLNFSSNNFISDAEKESAVSPKAMIITQNVFSSGYVFVTNIFFDKITNDHKNFGYVMTLTRAFNEKWSGFIENKAIKGNFYSDGILTAGAAYLITKDLQVDASISKNFKSTPDFLYGGIGISWRSDLKYKEVRLRKSGGGKKSKKSKDSKEEKSRKRVDDPVLDKSKK